MSDDPPYDRPNTVSGLVAKHAELTALREAYRAEIKKLTVDIDHLDGCCLGGGGNRDDAISGGARLRRHAARSIA